MYIGRSEKAKRRGLWRGNRNRAVHGGARDASLVRFARLTGFHVSSVAFSFSTSSWSGKSSVGTRVAERREFPPLDAESRRPDLVHRREETKRRWKISTPPRGIRVGWGVGGGDKLDRNSSA